MGSNVESTLSLLERLTRNISNYSSKINWEIRIVPYEFNITSPPFIIKINNNGIETPSPFSESEIQEVREGYYKSMINSKKNLNKKITHIKTEKFMVFFDFRDDYFAVLSSNESLLNSKFSSDEMINLSAGEIERDILSKICNNYYNSFIGESGVLDASLPGDNELFLERAVRELETGFKKRKNELISDFNRNLNKIVLDSYSSSNSILHHRLKNFHKRISVVKKTENNFSNRKWDLYVLSGNGLCYFSYFGRGKPKQDPDLICSYLSANDYFIEKMFNDKIRHIESEESVTLFQRIEYRENNTLEELLKEVKSINRTLLSLENKRTKTVDRIMLKKIEADIEEMGRRKFEINKETAELSFFLSMMPSSIILDASDVENGKLTGKLRGDEREALSRISRLFALPMHFKVLDERDARFFYIKTQKKEDLIEILHEDFAIPFYDKAELYFYMRKFVKDLRLKKQKIRELKRQEKMKRKTW